jgi:hypothetical protein
MSLSVRSLQRLRQSGGPKFVRVGKSAIRYRLGWGHENPAFRQLFTSQFIPGGTKQQADWFNELQRISATPEDAAGSLIANGNTDVTELLAQVSVPIAGYALA